LHVKVGVATPRSPPAFSANYCRPNIASGLKLSL
jgi:hypothetical protein